MKRIAVTGANGFVGRHVVRHAVAAGYEVAGIVRSRGGGAGGARGGRPPRGARGARPRGPRPRPRRLPGGRPPRPDRRGAGRPDLRGGQRRLHRARPRGRAPRRRAARRLLLGPRRRPLRHEPAAARTPTSSRSSRRRRSSSAPASRASSSARPTSWGPATPSCRRCCGPWRRARSSGRATAPTACSRSRSRTPPRACWPRSSARRAPSRPSSTSSGPEALPYARLLERLARVARAPGPPGARCACARSRSRRRTGGPAPAATRGCCPTSSTACSATRCPTPRRSRRSSAGRSLPLDEALAAAVPRGVRLPGFLHRHAPLEADVAVVGSGPARARRRARALPPRGEGRRPRLRPGRGAAPRPRPRPARPRAALRAGGPGDRPLGGPARLGGGVREPPAPPRARRGGAARLRLRAARQLPPRPRPRRGRGARRERGHAARRRLPGRVPRPLHAGDPLRPLGLPGRLLGGRGRGDRRRAPARRARRVGARRRRSRFEPGAGPGRRWPRRRA